MTERSKDSHRPNSSKANSSESCAEIELLLDAYHDAELSVAERQQIEEHLSVCSSCQSKLAEITKVVMALNGLPRLKPSRDLAAELPLEIDLPAHKSNVVSMDWLSWAATGLAAAAALVFCIVKVGQPNQTVISPVAAPSAQSLVTANAGNSQKIAGQQNAVAHQPPLATVAKSLDNQPRLPSLPVAPPKPERLRHMKAEPALVAHGNEISGAGATERAQEPVNQIDHSVNAEIATLDEVGHSTITGAIGLSTDEDGLYEIKL